MALTQKSNSFYLSDHSWRLLAGAISGAISRSCVAPIERTIILKQTNNQHYYGRSLISSLFYMYKTDGFFGMFKGNGANCLRIAPFQAIEFYLFDLLRNTFKFKNQTQAMFGFGAISGAAAIITVYPFDLVKTILSVQTKESQVQQKYAGIFRTIYQLVIQKGPFSLFKGLSATVIGMTPYASLKLTFFQINKNNFEKYCSFINKDIQSLCFGGLAGCMALSITYPTDVIRRRLQFQILQDQQHHGYFETMKNMFNSQGITVFYRGLVSTYAKVIPATAIAFAINEKLKRLRNLQ